MAKFSKKCRMKFNTIFASKRKNMMFLSSKLSKIVMAGKINVYVGLSSI